MAPSFTKSSLFLAVLLLLGLITTGQACTLNDFTIGTVRTGRIIQGKTEWRVIVTNTCSCGVQQVYLNCKGFQTVEPIDPNNVLSVHGDICFLINGRVLPSKGSVSFNFASDPPILFSPKSTVTVC